MRFPREISSSFLRGFVSDCWHPGRLKVEESWRSDISVSTLCVCVCVCVCVYAQSCLTLSNSLDWSWPGLSVHGIFQARILAWLPFPSAGDLPDPGTELASAVSLALAGGFLSIYNGTPSPRPHLGFYNPKAFMYPMEYYSAIKKNTLETVLMRWIKLEPIIQSEVSQKDKHQYSILTHIYGI